MSRQREPRSIRNFWLDGSVDGVSSRISTGPSASDGGFQLAVKMRDSNAIFTALTLLGDCDAETGRLTLRVQDASGEDLDIIAAVR